MSGIRVMIEIAPPPPERTSKVPTPMSVEDKVRHALEMIDSGHKSDVEWLMVNKLYKQLCKCKPSPRVQNLLEMIKPVLSKFGYHGTTSEGNR